MEGQITEVVFYGATLLTVLIGGVRYIAIKPISDALGLDWSAQYRRIKRHPVMGKGIAVMAMPSDGGKQDAMCIPLDKLNGWLFGISASRVKPELRARLVQYQAECFDVLAQHFGNKPDAAPSLKNRRWLISFDHAGKEVITSVPTDAYVMTVGEIAKSLYDGQFSRNEVHAIANAVMQRMYIQGCENKPTDVGDDLAEEIQKGKFDTVALYKVSVAASMRLWMDVGIKTGRFQTSAPAKQTQTGVSA